MTRVEKLQLIGPVALFAAILVAEAAARALAYSPSSELLWYFNLKWFAAFHRSHCLLSAYLSMNYMQLIAIALPLLMLALLGCAFRSRLPLAVASNLTFVYAAFLAYAWHGVPRASQTASLTSISIPTDPDLYLFIILIGASFVSFVISHVLYLRSVRARG